MKTINVSQMSRKFINKFSKWTLPSKYSVVGVWVSLALSIISIVLAVWGIPEMLKNKKENEISGIVKNLEDKLKNEKWGAYDHTLQELKKNDTADDTYNFYMGLGIISRDSKYDNVIDPDFYLVQIDVNSEYFERSILLRGQHYRKTLSHEEYLDRLKVLTQELESKKYYAPKYFMYRYLLTQFSSEPQYEGEYNLFQTQYNSGKNERFSPSGLSKKDGLVNLSTWHQISAIHFLYLTSIAIHTMDSHELYSARRRLQELFKDENDLTAVQWGFNELGLEMPTNEYLAQLLYKAMNV